MKESISGCYYSAHTGAIAYKLDGPDVDDNSQGDETVNKTDFIVDHAPGLKAATKALQEINKRLENAPESFFDKWEADAKAGRDPLARFDDELATFGGFVATSPTNEIGRASCRERV